MATNYPGSLDSFSRPTSSTAMDAAGYEGDAIIDNLSDAVEAVQSELGVDPAGALATVRERIAMVERLHSGNYVWPVNYYASNSTFVNNLGGGNTTTISPNQVSYNQWVCPFPVTIDRIAMKVLNSYATTMRVGIYSSDTSTGEPSSLLLDAGEVSTSTTGIKELTVNQSLDAGLYYLALHTNAGGFTVEGWGTGHNRGNSAASTNGSPAAYARWTQTSTYASGFPTTPAQWSSLVAASYALTFWMRRSA